MWISARVSAAEFRSIQKSKDLLRCYSIYSLYEYSVLNRLPISLKQIMLASCRKDLWSFSVLDMKCQQMGKQSVHLGENYRCILASSGIELINSWDGTMFWIKRKIILSIHGFFSCCWEEHIQSPGLLCCLYCPANEEAGVGQETGTRHRTADPTD